MTNREFKFRAWHEDTKTMHENITPWNWDFVISKAWHRCESTNGGLFGGGTEGEFLVPGVRFDVVMQYTGLKDMHGKEIYEGDVVRSSIPGGLPEVVKFEIKDIDRVWGHGDYGKDRMAGYSLCGYWGGPDKLEIIGNIYEHPELLK